MPRALVVGVNYAGQSCALRGCAHDANSLAEYLGERGYAVERLIDSEDPEDLKDSSSARTWNSPTRANILKGLLDLVLSGDSNLFFSFAGHGSRRYDASGDETDGRGRSSVPGGSQQGGC